MPTYDRNELLARVDLEGLFLELVGPPKGKGVSAKWRCPAPTHGEQSGESPPVSIDTTKALWHCHACGAGGSAIDLVMATKGATTGEAMGELARRAGVQPDHEPSTRPRATPAKEKARPGDVRRGDPAELAQYVHACAELLWRPEGAEVLEWLRSRGLADEVLRRNAVGADPGRSTLRRAAGLPAPTSAAAVFPLMADGAAVYCQTRPLEPGTGAKYLNPQEAVWGKNPRVAELDAGEGAGGTVLVCEGMPDALTAAGAGYRTVAVLGAGYPDAGVATTLLARFSDEHLVLAFDGDARGIAGAGLLAGLLIDAGAGRRVWNLAIPDTVAADPKDRDLNTWAQTAGSGFVDELSNAVTSADPAGWERVRSAADRLPGFIDRLRDQRGALAVPTGIPTLDGLFAGGGWRPGLFLLGGLPGIGKSAFALQSALRAAAGGHPAVYVSVEQSEDELLGRIFCHELQSPIGAYWNRDPNYLAGVERIQGGLSLENLYLRSDPYIAGEDYEGTAGRIRRWCVEVGELTGLAPLVVVDYLQRMRPPEAERRLDERLRISMAGLGLRQLARDLEVPVVVVSSIGRGSYDGFPKLDWFKGSGDLEYDADAAVILSPCRLDDDEDAPARPIAVELHVVKNRYGRLTAGRPVELTFDRRFGSFHEPRRPGAPPRSDLAEERREEAPPLRLADWQRGQHQV